MSRFVCTSMPTITRRSVLLAASAVLTLASGPADAADELQLADLVDSAGVPTARARSLSQQAVTLRGYLDVAPSGPGLLLTEMPAGPCGLCGLGHDAGRGIAVDLVDAPPATAQQQSIGITGNLTLGTDGQVRLVRARVVA